MLLLVLGGAGAVAPSLTNGRWKPYVPDTVLIELYGRVEETWVLDELERRTQGEYFGRDVRTFRELWSWQWDRLTQRLRVRIADSGTSAPDRRDAVAFLLGNSPTPERVFDELLSCYDDPDPQVRFVAMWGMKACRHEFAPHREEILVALRPHVGVLDKNGEDNALLCLRAFEAVTSGPLPPLKRPGAGRCLDPGDVVARLSGATSEQLIPIFRQLGIWPRFLMWPYAGESGPFQVIRHDMELDGRAGIDCALQISDPYLTHTQLLLFTCEFDRWTFAGTVDQANNAHSPAVIFMEADEVGPVLVSRMDGRKTWWDFRFRVRAGGITRLSQVVIDKLPGEHQAK
jgi:hypothetical protein